MKQLPKIILSVFFFSILTVVTQVGGLAFLTSILTFGYVNRKVVNGWVKIAFKGLSFVIAYFIFTFLIVPPIAKQFGRVPLPMIETQSLKPANILTCLLNRNYVKPELKRIALSVSRSMNKKYPDTKVNYLEANFPFIDHFPLLPHLSHNDGKKLDLSFQYSNSENGNITNNVPSFIGYGICEEPRKGEENIAGYCNQKGYWQYSMLRNTIPQNNKAKFKFDEKRVREVLTKLEKDGEAVDTTGHRDLGLPDPDDEPFLAAALAGQADYLVTGNLADFPAARRRGCEVLSPAEFMEIWQRLTREAQ